MPNSRSISKPKSKSKPNYNSNIPKPTSKSNTSFHQSKSTQFYNHLRELHHWYHSLRHLLLPLSSSSSPSPSPSYYTTDVPMDYSDISTLPSASSSTSPYPSPNNSTATPSPLPVHTPPSPHVVNLPNRVTLSTMTYAPNLETPITYAINHLSIEEIQDQLESDDLNDILHSISNFEN